MADLNRPNQTGASSMKAFRSALAVFAAFAAGLGLAFVINPLI